MPELPEVETTKRGIQNKTEHATIQSIEIRNGKLRWPVPTELVKLLPGLRIDSVTRRAKYLLLNTPKGTIIIHLGMSGNLRTLPHSSPIQKHDHIDLVFTNGWLLRYHDPRRFGAWLWTDQQLAEHPLLKHLAPEPLSEAFNANWLFDKIQNRKIPIKTIVMDNKMVVGAGNIYANESLFLAGIHPLKPANSLNFNEVTRLVNTIKQVLAAAIQQGGTTLKDFLQPDGKPGYFVQSLQVYGRANEPCHICKQTIQKFVLNQRACYVCPSCQPEPC